MKLRRPATFRFLLAALAALAANAASTAHSQVILARYDFEVANPGVDSTPNTPANPNTLAPVNLAAGLTASAISLGGDLTVSGGGTSTNTSHRTGVHDYNSGVYPGSATDFVASGGQNANGTTASGALYLSKAQVSNGTAVDTATSEYFAFNLTPQAGNTLQLSSLSLFALETGGNDGAVLSLYYSFDNFATFNLVGAGNITIPESYGSGLSIDLSSIAELQDVDSSESLAFRVYTADGNNGSAGRSLRFDDVIVRGTVIPEPGAGALLALGLAAVCLVRRRRA